MSKAILLIDDEKIVTRSLSLLLKSAGYDATVAHSGTDALDKVKKCDFSLIICDVRMPELDGVETIKEIRAYLQSSNKKLIPEILITGYADADKYEKAMDLNVADYLYKPFDNQDLMSMVKKIIG